MAVGRLTVRLNLWRPNPDWPRMYSEHDDDLVYVPAPQANLKA